MKVVLKSDSELFDEVMVVAYGTAKKSSYAASTFCIPTKETITVFAVPDVYKRQLLGIPFEYFLDFSDVFQILFLALLPDARSCTVLDAVSYTHLDVYKRQGPHSGYK